MINETLRKNINIDEENILPIFTFKEGDNALLKLALFKNSDEFDITGQTVKLGAKTSKGLIEQIDGFTISKNNLDIELKNSILVPGIIEIDLEIKDSNGSMTTASFFITVNRKVLNDEAVKATNEFDTFTKAIDKIEAAVKTVTSHTDNTIIHITSAERNKWNAKSNLGLGETETTAYRGDRGTIAYTHSQTEHAPSNAQANVQSDWNVTDNMSDAYIKNKPDIPKEYDDSEIRSLLDNLENEVNELKEGNHNIDLTNYATKTELSLKVDKITGKSLISDSEIERLSTLKNYDDTEIKNTLNSKADKTELHSHTNKTVLDGISSAKVTEWNNKSTFSGNYNDLTNKPTIPTLNGYATEQYVNEEIKKIDVTEQLTDYAKKSELHSHSNKSVLDGITTTNITNWNNKSNFSGNYNDLTNKPTIPKPSNYKTAYGTCSSPAETSEKVVVIDNPNWELEVGNIIGIRHSYSNTASNVTINVNNTGAYPIWYGNSQYEGSSSTYVGYSHTK